MPHPTIVRTGFLALALAIAGGSSSAQAPPGGGGGQTGGGGTGGGTTQPGGGRTGPTTQSPELGQRSPMDQMGMDRPIFLSGRVMLAEGGAPPTTVIIERVCGASPRPEAYTDSKGRFSFQLGQNQAVFSDASVSNADGSGSFGDLGSVGTTASRNDRTGAGRRTLTERDLMGCELRASLPGYRSSVVPLSGRRVLDNPDVGTIVLTRMGDAEGTLISVASSQAPKDAKKAFEKGKNLAGKQKFDEAQKEFQKAVEIYPKYTDAWFNLAKLHAGQNHPADARKAYEQAIVADPKFLYPYKELARLSFAERNWQDLADTTGRALKLDPFSFPDMHFYHAVAQYYLKNGDAAEKSAREAIKLDTRHQIPASYSLLASILLDRNDYPAAAEQMREFLKYARGGEMADRVKKQLEQVEQALAAKKE